MVATKFLKSTSHLEREYSYESWDQVSSSEDVDSDQEIASTYHPSPLQTGTDRRISMKDLEMRDSHCNHCKKPSFASKSFVSTHMKRNLRGLGASEFEGSQVFHGEDDFVQIQEPKLPRVSFINWHSDGECSFNEDALNQASPRPPACQNSPAMSSMDLSDAEDPFQDVAQARPQQSDLISKMYSLLAELQEVSKSKFNNVYSTQLKTLSTRIGEGDFDTLNHFATSVRLVFKGLKGDLYVASEGTNGLAIFQLMQFEFHLGSILPAVEKKAVRWATIQTPRAPPAAKEIQPFFSDPAPPVPEFFTFPTTKDEEQASYFQTQKAANRMEYLLERLERTRLLKPAADGNSLKNPLLAPDAQKSPLSLLPCKSSQEQAKRTTSCLGSVLDAVIKAIF